jgi:hypothetical protein
LKLPSKKSDRKALLSPATVTAQNAIKCNLLSVLDVITSEIKFIKIIHSPVNLLYSELVQLYTENPIMLYSHHDSEFRLIVSVLHQMTWLTKKIFKILAHYAHYTEYIYRYDWDEMTSEMSLDRKRYFRKKLDKFLWRICNRLNSLLDAQVSSSLIYLIVLRF